MSVHADQAPPPAGREDPPAWGWWLGPLAVAAAFTLVVVVAIAVSAVLGAGELSRLTDDYPQATGIVQDLLWIGVAIGLPLAVYGSLRPGDLGLEGRPDVRAAAVTAAGLLVFYLVAAAYGLAAGLDEDSNQRLKESGLGVSIGSDLGYVALYVVMAPVAEELLFRGLLFGSLRGRFGHWPAALVSGAVFGAIHLGAGQDPFIPVLTALGVVLALAYHYSGALYAAIAIHAINNAVSTGSSHQPAADWIYAVLAAGPLVAVALAYLLGRAVKAWTPQQARQPARPSSARS